MKLEFMDYIDKNKIYYYPNKDNIFKDVNCFKNRIVRAEKQAGGSKMYYFDKEGIYRVIPELVKANEFEMMGSLGLSRRGNVTLPRVVKGVCIQNNWLRAVISSLTPNEDSLKTLVERYNLIVEKISEDESLSAREILEGVCKEYKLKKLSKSAKIVESSEVSKEVKDFIYKINKPIIERDAENTNHNTFDFVRIYVSVPTFESFPERKNFIKDNMRDIIKLVLDVIGNNSSYKKYGVPVSFLKPDTITLTKQSELMFLFSLKG